MHFKTARVGSFGETEASEWGRANAKLFVEIALVLWLIAVFVLGAKGVFVREPGRPPVPIVLGVVVPLIAFFAAYFRWDSFRAMVLSSDLRLGAAIQGWRFAGLGFLALYAHGVLPGSFALPAGLGDIAIGATAPWIVLALIRHAEFAGTRPFVIWNVLGILDLVVAISSGAMSAGMVPEVTGNVTTTPMSQLPLVLIPVYFVPIFVMLHAAALFQARRFAASARREAEQ
jgi:hypothetical protein